MGLITSLAGGRPGMISGSTGATAVMMIELVAVHGVEYLFFAVMLAGIFEMMFGMFKLGKLLRFIPHPVMVGFCNGLGIVIGLAQFAFFQEKADPVVEEGADADAPGRHLLVIGQPFQVFSNGVSFVTGMVAFWVAVEVLVTFLIAFLLPKYSTAIPSSMVGIAVATTIEWAIVRQTGSETTTVEDLASVAGSFPKIIFFNDEYNLPSISGEMLGIILPTLILIAIVSLVESLMTLELIDEITETVGDPNREGEPRAKRVASPERSELVTTSVCVCVSVCLCVCVCVCVWVLLDRTKLY